MIASTRTIRVVAAVLGLGAALHGARELAAQPRIERSTLANGLTLQLLEDHSSQVVSVSLWYDVGARDEAKGKTGFAHLFEHMMFQGSAHVKKAEHSQLIERAGGRNNANTQYDITRYYEEIPSNRVNLALWLEADRLRSLNVNAENLKNQIEAVKEERRLRVDNQPYGKAIWEATLPLFDSTTCFPYAHSLIGSMDDLNASSVADVQDFFRRHYAPNTAVLTVAGDINPAEVKRLVQEYFGDIPRQPDAPKPACHQPFGTGRMTTRVRDDKATLPAVLALYRVPETGHPDTPALDLLSTILGSGESSRFNRVLARETKLALGQQVILNPFGPRRGPGFFLALAVANQGVNPDSLDARLEAEVTKVAAGGVTEEELTKAKNQYRAAKVNERQTAFDMTEAIQAATFYLGDPNAVFTDLERYAKVTLDDIKRVAATYLVPANSLIVTVVPPAAPAAPKPVPEDNR
ncbi:MAG: pitrilysin family protein [Gemmatimonadota bacterium]|nr:pitrilysin family protein [Gemmatimonadota bacterium]